MSHVAPIVFSVGSGAKSLRARLVDLARKPFAVHRPLALVTAGAVGLLVASLVLQAFDGRQVVGAPTWLKPAKFAASIAVTAPTLAWILQQMRFDRRWRRLQAAGTVVAIVAALELVGITVQAARGVPSHFNHATPAGTALFAAMGVSIGLLWLAEVYVAVRAFRHDFATPLRAWGIRLALVGTLAGGAIGFVMTRPTPAQMETLRAHRPAPLLGAHEMRSASPTVARAYRSPAGAPKAGISARPISLACTPCRCCPWPLGSSSAVDVARRSPSSRPMGPLVPSSASGSGG